MLQLDHRLEMFVIFTLLVNGCLPAIVKPKQETDACVTSRTDCAIFVE